MNDLAKAPDGGKGMRAQRFLLLASLMLLVIPAGCMQTISDPLMALRVDKTTTGTVVPLSVEADMLSDEDTIASAVGIARLGEPYPWSNSATGAAGVITAISPTTTNGRHCREFKTSRHGFDGIALFSGLTCQTPEGSWLIETFERVQS